MNSSPDSDALANVLVVDDRKADLLLTQIALKDVAQLQCNLLVAMEGKEALDILHERLKIDARIDLILLDINMPGMDGFEMLERVREDSELRHVAVIICTGSNYHKDMERARQLGAAGYMIKPVAFDKLEPILNAIPALTLRHHGEDNRLLRAADF